VSDVTGTGYIPPLLYISCSADGSRVSEHLEALLTAGDSVGLYIKVLELIKTDLETPATRGMIRQVGATLFVTLRSIVCLIFDL